MDPFATITEMVDSAGHEADTLQQAEVKELLRLITVLSALLPEQSL